MPKRCLLLALGNDILKDDGAAVAAGRVGIQPAVDLEAQRY